MKTLRILAAAVVLSLPLAAFAQTADAQKSFETLKSLAGTWEGPLTTTPKVPDMEKTRMKVQIRVTSRGNAVMHEMAMTGLPDNPITMLYLDAGSLSLTHYCDAGNRPHMTGSASDDGKSIAFKLVDLSGSDQKGHMADTVFTFVDATHHIEEWTYHLPNHQTVTARFDLQRTKDASGPFGQ